jgi:hypothetical protein
MRVRVWTGSVKVVISTFETLPLFGSPLEADVKLNPRQKRETIVRIRQAQADPKPDPPSSQTLSESGQLPQQT